MAPNTQPVGVHTTHKKADMINSILSSDNEVIKQDPVLRLLCVRLRWSNARIILVASLFSAFILLIIGGIARRVYQPFPDTPYIGNDLILIVMWTVIFSPIMWLVYLWQAQTISRLFIQLSDKGVFGVPNSESWLT